MAKRTYIEHEGIEVIDDTPKPMPTVLRWRAIYHFCSRCVHEYDIEFTSYIGHLSELPLTAQCDHCGEIELNTAAFTRITNDSERCAHDVAMLLRSHGFECHITLINTIRVLDGFTYRDDNGCLQYADEWMHLDPTQLDVVYEFLGY